MMDNILNDFLKAIQTLNSMKIFYIIESAMPTEMEFDGVMKPAAIIIPASVTYLDRDLLIMHPNIEQEVLEQIGHMLKPVTKSDWMEASERAIAKANLFPLPDPPTPEPRRTEPIGQRSDERTNQAPRKREDEL